MERLGPWRAVLLTGLLHGLWRLPVILLTASYHPSDNRFIVAPRFQATLTIAGMLFGYLRLRTDSVWPAVIAHSAHNTVWAFAARFTVGASPEYLAGDSGLLDALGYTLLAGALMAALTRRSRRKSLRVGPEANADGVATGSLAHRTASAEA